MRRSYEYKEESYIVHETRGWNYPSNTYKVLDEPSFHYDPSFHHGHHRMHHEDGSHGWSATQNADHNLLLKKNEHHALGANTILRRPPLGTVNPPPSHQDSHDHNMYLSKNRWGYDGDVYDDYRGGSSHNSSWMVMKNKHKEDSKPYVGVQEFEDFDDGKLGKALSYLIKELDGYPPRGAVKKIEVIQYERTTYGGGGGGFGPQRKDSWFKGF